MILRPPAALSLLLALALAGCAASEPADPTIGASEADLPPIPFCRDEMVAFIELSQLARTHGEGWILFSPAIEALKQRIVDCVGDAQARFKGL
jgi:7-cyano-7-deazaguanine synthase in queuosine biosynthesis